MANQNNIPRAGYFPEKDGGLDLMGNEILNQSIDIKQLEKQGIVLNSYTVTETDLMRPDRISYKIYKDSSLWSILMRVNNVVDPVNDLYVGMKLKVLPANVLMGHLNTAKSKKTNRNS